MEDIKVTSSIDFKTYFNISLLIGLKLRTILLMILFVVVISYMTLDDPSMQLWLKLLIAVGIFVFYAGLIVLMIYFGCRRNIKRSALLNETLTYSLNDEKIESKGETISSTNGWKYIMKLVEREKYFLLMPSARTFYYLPKSGFEFQEEIARFKNLVKEKGIKIKYN